MAVHDVDRSVAAMAHKSWTSTISVDSAPEQASRLVLDQRFRPSLITFTQRAILDPNGVYAYLNPAPPVSAPLPPKKGMRKEDPEQAARSKAEELEENEPDRAARLRVGAFGAVRRILGKTSPREHVTGSYLADRNRAKGSVGRSGGILQESGVLELVTPRRAVFVCRLGELWLRPAKRSQGGVDTGADIATHLERSVLPPLHSPHLLTSSTRTLGAPSAHPKLWDITLCLGRTRHNGSRCNVATPAYILERFVDIARNLYL